MDLDEMLRVDRCRDMDKLILSPIRIIVWMLEPDCFLQYRMHCNAEFYYAEKIRRIGIGRPLLQWGMVLKWFYSPQAMGTPLLEVNMLYWLPE